MKTFLPPYKPWIIPALCSVLYARCMILISAHLNLDIIRRYLDVDYVTHWRFNTPFETLNNLDALVFWGVQVIYWGLELFLFIVCFNTTKSKINWRESTAKLCVFMATGMMIFYMVLTCTMFSLAVHEGYHPKADTLYRMNHGPWHSVSHLGFMVIYDLLIVVGSIIIALVGLIIRFSRQGVSVLLLSIAFFWYHVDKLLWLID